MYLMQKKGMLEKHDSGMSYSPVGSDFSVNESAVYTESGIFMQKHVENKFDENVEARGSQDPNPLFPLGEMVQCSLIHYLWQLYRI